jgi:hypothetical protein
MRICKQNFDRNIQGKGPLKVPRRKSEDKIKSVLKTRGFEIVERIEMVQDITQWRWSGGDYFKNGNELSGSKKGAELVEELSYY